MVGWVKMHRAVREHWIWQNADYFKWWTDLIMEAGYEPRRVLVRGQVVQMARGEIQTSIVELSKRWGKARSVVQKFLDLLISENMIELTQCSYFGTGIKLLNYGLYQDKNQATATAIATANTTAIATTQTTSNPLPKRDSGFSKEIKNSTNKEYNKNPRAYPKRKSFKNFEGRDWDFDKLERLEMELQRQKMVELGSG